MYIYMYKYMYICMYRYKSMYRVGRSIVNCVLLSAFLKRSRQRWASAIEVRNSAILRTTKSIAELRTKKSFGTAVADLQNLTSAIPQLSAISYQFRYFLVPFPQLRMDLKINQKYF